MSNWRRPLNAVAEETGTQVMPHFRPGWRPLKWWLFPDDQERVARRMACWQCMQVFPAPPCPENLRLFKREAPELVDWHPTIPMIGEARIRAYCCPICDSDCSAEMVATQIEFTPGGPKRPGAPNYLTDRDYEQLLAGEQAVIEATQRRPGRL